MSRAIEKMRRAFDGCTAMAGGTDGFECVIVTKSVAVSMLDDIEAENEKLREMVTALWKCCAWETDSGGWCEECDHHDTEEGGCRLKSLAREFGIEVDE